MAVSYAYGPAGELPDTKFGTFPQLLMHDDRGKGWVVTGRKYDWARFFAGQSSHGGK